MGSVGPDLPVVERLRRYTHFPADVAHLLAASTPRMAYTILFFAVPFAACIVLLPLLSRGPHRPRSLKFPGVSFSGFGSGLRPVHGLAGN